MRIGRLLLISAALIAACSHPHANAPAPVDSAWTATFDSSQRLAADSQFAAADSLLLGFAQGSQGTAGASEALFWHGLFQLEPANPGGSMRTAAEAFGAYLESGATPHRAEAMALRRSAQMIDSLAQSRTMDSVPSVHLVVTDDTTRSSAREQELAKSLKATQDSLNKTTAELERIKKRLSTGKP